MGMQVTDEGVLLPVPVQLDGAQVVFRNYANSVYAVVKVREFKFEDTAGHWGETEIAWLAGRGIVQGMGQNKFKPELSVTRAELTQMVTNALGLWNRTPARSLFVDVQPEAWYGAAVTQGVDFELIGGVTEMSFQPNAAATREVVEVIGS